MDDFDLELAYLDGRCTNVIDARQIYLLMGDGSTPAGWIADQVLTSHLLKRDADWTLLSGRPVVAALSALMMAGSDGWNADGWERIAREIKAKLVARLAPDLFGFDHLKAYKQLDRVDRSMCNTGAFDSGRQQDAIERRRREFIWLRLNNHPLPV